MLITKRRTSVTIKCTHSDFAMLSTLANALPAEERRRICTGYARAALTKRTKDGALMRVDVDKSKR